MKKKLLVTACLVMLVVIACLFVGCKGGGNIGVDSEEISASESTGNLTDSDSAEENVFVCKDKVIIWQEGQIYLNLSKGGFTVNRNMDALFICVEGTEYSVAFEELSLGNDYYQYTFGEQKKIGSITTEEKKSFFVTIVAKSGEESYTIDEQEVVVESCIIYVPM